jgi:osmotically-inducible protein OsmY
MNVRGVDVSGIRVDAALASAARQPVTDEQIKIALIDAFVSDPRVLSWKPDVTVQYGVVTLRGVVTNLDAVRASERDARSTVGVRDVVNLLKVKPRKARTDAVIAQDVMAALRRDPWLDDDSIDVKSSRGVVTLSGDVGTVYEQNWADSLAGRVNGVVRVMNRLSVQHGRVFYYGFTTWVPAEFHRDNRIRNAIESQMWWSPYVDANQVVTSVWGGIATLTGTVDSWSERSAAVENAYEGGALSVVDKLEVRP